MAGFSPTSFRMELEAHAPTVKPRRRLPASRCAAVA